MSSAQSRTLVRQLAVAGIRAADAGDLLLAALSADSLLDRGAAGRTFVIAVGKASVPMYRAFLHWATRPPHAAIVAAPDATEGLGDGAQVFRCGHPEPTAASVAAAEAALALAAHASPADRLVVLLSGGASALMAAPAPPVTLEDKVALTRWALRRGLPIEGLNAVRKHVSRIKGGQLAAATGAAVHTFALSDVNAPCDDDPSTIGSGPTVSDPTTFDGAWNVLSALDAQWPSSHPRVAACLADGRRGVRPETPKPGDTALDRARFVLIGNRHNAVLGAHRAADQLGIAVRTRAMALVGEARDAAVRFVDEAAAATDDLPRPCCYLASGETTVTVRGGGRGGRNQEFALAASLALDRQRLRAAVASVGTDGVDGPTSAAGAVGDETTSDRATRLGLDPASALADNDSHSFFAALGDLIDTGPTGTNVGDLMLFVRL